MRKITFFLPLAALALTACGYSVSDAVDDIKNADNSAFEDGKTISITAATTAAFTEVKALGPDNIVFVTGDAFTIKAEGNLRLRHRTHGLLHQCHLRQILTRSYHSLRSNTLPLSNRE